jgi:hypothetical protein
MTIESFVKQAVQTLADKIDSIDLAQQNSLVIARTVHEHVVQRGKATAAVEAKAHALEIKVTESELRMHHMASR